MILKSRFKKYLISHTNSSLTMIRAHNFLNRETIDICFFKDYYFVLSIRGVCFFLLLIFKGKKTPTVYFGLMISYIHSAK